jgi:dipeptidyl aminopeptidase/acylaminoacyl peptidase
MLLDADVRDTFGVSSSGALVHVIEPVQLIRIFRDGRRTAIGTMPDGARTPRISPDGRRVVFVRNGLWMALLDNLRATARRLTRDESDSGPVWSPDGRRLAFGRATGEPSADLWLKPRGIYSVAVDASSAVERLALHGDGPVLWSSATGRVGYQRYIGGAGGSLWTTTPGEGTSRLVLRSPDEIFMSAALSGDGKRLAFEWTRSEKGNPFGEFTYIYVAPFMSGGRPTEMPFLDAYNPAWSRTGDELFFEKNGRLLVTRVSIGAEGATPAFGEPVVVREQEPGYRQFDWEARSHGERDYDVMPDAGSVLVTSPMPAEIVVVPDVLSRRIQ